MPKITKTTGESYATDPDELEPVDELEDDGAPQEPQDDAGPDDDGETPGDGESDEEPVESDDPDDVDPDAVEAIDLPPVNALRAVWEQALVDAGVSADWVAAAATKDVLIETGRRIAEGSIAVVNGMPVEV